MSDTSKTIRSFQCRDTLWEKFEQMARELECSVDYLINDSMKQYARQRGYGSTRGGGLPAPSRTSLQPPAPMASNAPTVAPPPPPGAPPPAAPPPLPVSVAAPPPPPGAPPPVPRQRSRTPGVGAPPLPPPVAGGAPPPPGPPPPARSRAAAPPPVHQSAAPPPRAVAAPRRAINAYYNGQRFTVTKDQFIIGRGKQTSDLTIKDPNVSRQHAMVEFLGGNYFMVDLGSTNGVEFNGQRVQRQPINEGDVFRVCDHELRFSFY